MFFRDRAGHFGFSRSHYRDEMRNTMEDHQHIEQMLRKARGGDRSACDALIGNCRNRLEAHIRSKQCSVCCSMYVTTASRRTSDLLFPSAFAIKLICERTFSSHTKLVV